MNSKILHINFIRDVFENVVDGFVGNLSMRSSELDEMRQEFNEGKIPSVSQDRHNLRQDAANVYSDYKKAFDEKKAVHSL